MTIISESRMFYSPYLLLTCVFMPRVLVDILNSIWLVTLTKDRKASLHPGLCKCLLSSLGSRSLIHYWTVFRDVNHDDTQCRPPNKTTSGIWWLVSICRAMLLACWTFFIWDTETHRYCTVTESSPSVPRQPTIKTTSGIRRFGVLYSFFSFILVCAIAILTPLVANWFKPTQNHSKVYTYWRHKWNTSIWEHQHNISTDWYVNMFHLF